MDIGKAQIYGIQPWKLDATFVWFYYNNNVFYLTGFHVKKPVAVSHKSVQEDFQPFQHLMDAKKGFPQKKSLVHEVVQLKISFCK